MYIDETPNKANGAESSSKPPAKHVHKPLKLPEIDSAKYSNYSVPSKIFSISNAISYIQVTKFIVSQLEISHKIEIVTFYFEKLYEMVFFKFH